MTTTTHPLVVVGVDGSPDAERALSWAQDYAAMSGARLRLVAAWEAPTLFGRPVSHDDSEDLNAARTAMAAAVAELRLPADRVEQLVPVGAAGPTLVDLSQDADLLVVGRRASGHAFGSASDYCLHHAGVPVVVAR